MLLAEASPLKASKEATAIRTAQIQERAVACLEPINHRLQLRNGLLVSSGEVVGGHGLMNTSVDVGCDLETRPTQPQQTIHCAIVPL